MGKREFDRVRRIALALPEVNERLSHGELVGIVEDAFRTVAPKQLIAELDDR